MNEEASTPDRLLELLAGDRLHQLTPEERDELEGLMADRRDGAERGDEIDDSIGRLLVEIDDADDAPGMPGAFRDRLARRGVALLGEPSGIAFETPEANGRRGRGGSAWGWVAAAAGLLLAVGVGAFALREIDRRDARLAEVTRDAESRIAENERLLADAQSELRIVSERLAETDGRRIELAERLADATRRLDEAELRIARYEEPQDPAVLAANRRKLLDLSGTIRIAWQPFDVPGLPDTEQPDVSGDVVWNDDLQEGYLRFEGLAVNDPAEEQYQVWVIDDRGMEQKVSGGVFNASVEGEVVVPIDPGIDVGRVQLFAVTVEEPGGIWVPDLRRRVVVAPRGAEQG